MAIAEATPGGEKVSIVVPVFNEGASLQRLIEELETTCAGLDRSFEVIVVDDGSTDGSPAFMERLAAQRPWLHCVRLRRNFGKSAALAVGFEYSDGDVIATIDGDGQDDPADLPRLIAKLDTGSDLVSGWKLERRDAWTRRLASRIFNFITSRFAGVEVHDINCGLKAYRAECAHSLDIYGEMHRFMPVLAAQQGWRVSELPVNHRPRAHGRSRFGVERYRRAAFDLLTVAFIGRYQSRPLHLFGALGLILGMAGVGISLYLTILKLGGEEIGQRPLLVLGVLLILVGVQLLSLGLLGQLLVSMRTRQIGLAQVERVIGGERGRSAKETSR